MAKSQGKAGLTAPDGEPLPTRNLARTAAKPPRELAAFDPAAVRAEYNRQLAAAGIVRFLSIKPGETKAVRVKWFAGLRKTVYKGEASKSAMFVLYDADSKTLALFKSNPVLGGSMMDFTATTPPAWLMVTRPETRDEFWTVAPGEKMDADDWKKSELLFKRDGAAAVAKLEKNPPADLAEQG